MFTPDEGISSIHFQTEFLWKDPWIVKAVATVASVVQKDYIGSTGMDWKHRVNKGSFTFYTEDINPKLVITLFIDFGNKLADKFHLRIHDDPFVIAVDMSMLPDFIKNTIRTELGKKFRLYQDPRITDKKVFIQPIEEHCFDIIFLERGNCEGHGEFYEQFLIEIETAINNNKFFDKERF